MAGREDYGLVDLLNTFKMGFGGHMVPLSAFAWGGQADLPESSGPEGPAPGDIMYHVFGVALAVAEVDVLTGERRVLRSDVMFDLGRPVNPAVDLGQVEGAFVQGLGMMLSEKAEYDSTTGSLVQNSTWSYKPPAASCVPATFNVTLLKDAPLASAVRRAEAGRYPPFPAPITAPLPAKLPLGAKACGEPPLLLSSVALMALQRATQAGRREAAARLRASAKPHPGAGAAASGAGAEDAGSGGEGFVPLLAPATVERVRAACGPWSAAELLAAKLQ
ncbi:hypothetical protein GPECTOR_11g85 [Gonium pectorale]|uniref:Aldehyde oxidase/xanthine dehydrogenase second molybdopterin binding domain-containing protein n=1 Tax=Gonium pectorale TaxID=33097 RepID=A0A150GQE0_GONPE|nr:hypothetical protein GPECTOR_11g85 [Gonium pectorale]|eukprot:KXZ51962.1 hypothetical protein GPECTOR_11g85 [Gonium pectorale]